METLGKGRSAPSTLSLVAMIVITQLVAGTAWAAPAPVRVNVTGEQLDPKDAKALEPSVRKAAEGTLRDEHGVVLEDDAQTEVKIEIRPFGDTKPRDAVIFRVTVSTDGNEVYAGHPTSWFKEDDAELLEVVRTRVTEAAEHLPEQPEPTAVEAAATDADPGVEESTAGIDDEADTTAPPSEGGAQPAEASLTLRNVGLGLLVPGGVALGVGIGLVAAGTREVDDGLAVEITERNYRPPGIGVAVLGGVAVAAGIGLLVTHAVRKRSSERLGWGPMLEGSHAGVVLRGRF
ncbi:hypothetical protein OEB96_46370 [Paraliomyxa miuraensis]|nr:hypothetical protein [Paraliomyxa miuraensis]